MTDTQVPGRDWDVTQKQGGVLHMHKTPGLTSRTWTKTNGKQPTRAGSDGNNSSSFTALLLIAFYITYEDF